MKKRQRKGPDFWNERRRAALMLMQKKYDLKTIELVYLRAAITEEPASSELNDAVIAQLDALAEDVRIFFSHNCPTDSSDPSPAQFREVLNDVARQNRHREVWNGIRSSLVESVLDRTRTGSHTMPRAEA